MVRNWVKKKKKTLVTFPFYMAKGYASACIAAMHKLFLTSDLIKNMDTNHKITQHQCFLACSSKVLWVLKALTQEGCWQTSFSTWPWTIKKWSTIFSYSLQSTGQIGQRDFPAYFSICPKMWVRKLSSSLGNLTKQMQQLFSVDAVSWRERDSSSVLKAWSDPIGWIL